MQWKNVKTDGCSLDHRYIVQFLVSDKRQIKIWFSRGKIIALKKSSSRCLSVVGAAKPLLVPG